MVAETARGFPSQSKRQACASSCVRLRISLIMIMTAKSHHDCQKSPAFVNMRAGKLMALFYDSLCQILFARARDSVIADYLVRVMNTLPSVLNVPP